MPGPSTNLPIVDVEETIDYFSKVFNEPVNVTQAQIDALYAFFIARTENEATALALVNTVVVTAFGSRINPMVMLDRFKDLNDDLKLDQQLAIFLNSTRNNTSLLGVKNVPQVNDQISRTILS